MNVNVDRDECTGCGLCAKEYSGLFQMEDEKAAVGLVHVPRPLESAARDAANDCPAGAIHVGEARGLMLSGRSSSNSQSWIAL